MSTRKFLGKLRYFFSFSLKDIGNNPSGPSLLNVLSDWIVLLLIAFLFLLTFCVVAINSLVRGTTEKYEAELNNPLLWVTEVRGRSETDIMRFMEAERDSYESAASFERALETFVAIDNSEYIRQIADIAQEGDYYQAANQAVASNTIELRGRAISSGDPTWQYIKKDVDFLRPVETLGVGEVIIRKDVLGTKGGLRLSIEDGVYMPLEVVGFSDSLPFGDFLIGDDIYKVKYSVGLQDMLARDIFDVEVKCTEEGKPKMNPGAMERLPTELSRLLRRQVEIIAEPDCRILMWNPVTEDDVPYMSISLSAPVYSFVFADAVAIAAPRAGVSTGSLLFKPEIPPGTVWQNREWIFLLKKDISLVEAFVKKCNDADLTADTGVISRVRSLLEAKKLILFFFSVIRYIIIAMFLFVIALLFFLDNYRKLHRIGTIKALGASYRYCLWSYCLQFSLLYVVASSMALVLAYAIMRFELLDHSQWGYNFDLSENAVYLTCMYIAILVLVALVRAHFLRLLPARLMRME